MTILISFYCISRVKKEPNRQSIVRSYELFLRQNLAFVKPISEYKSTWRLGAAYRFYFANGFCWPQIADHDIAVGCRFELQSPAVFKCNLQYGADDGNRTRVTSLGSSGNNHYTTSAQSRICCHFPCLLQEEPYCWIR